MKIDINKYNPPFTLYGNGQIPHHQIPLNRLKESGTIISIDGGADKLKSLKLDSHIILGDLDSLKKTKPNYIIYNSIYFKVDGVEMSDRLQKVNRFILENYRFYENINNYEVLKIKK